MTRYAYYQAIDESGCATVGGVCHRAGGLAQVTDVVGHVRTILAYDRQGRALRQKDANGVVTDVTNTARGWLASRTIRAKVDGSASSDDATTKLNYEATGALKNITDPDGVILTMIYDDAHRLVDVADGKGNRVHYILDDNGKRDFSRNGRQGQKQDGVDIWGHDQDRRLIGIQCKNTKDGISFATVKDETANAEKFKPILGHLYIATSADRDGPVQEQVRLFSEQRVAAGKFPVDLYFWSHIERVLSGNQGLLAKYYPFIKSPASNRAEHDLALYEDLMQLLPSSGVVQFINQHNMAFSFSTSELDALDAFIQEWDAPDKDFLTPEIEILKKALLRAGIGFRRKVAQETFYAGPGRRSVPEEWEMSQRERYERVLKELNGLADTFMTSYRNFVRGAKRILFDDPEA